MSMIKNKPQIPQGSEEWLEKRRSMITASNVASLLSRSEKACGAYNKSYPSCCQKIDRSLFCNPYQDKNSVIINKLLPETEKININMEWGQLYEPIARDLYQKMTGNKITPIGLITHSKYSWLGASPDGLLEDGKLIEIKCPRKRRIRSRKPPSLMYWIQMQIQMEVCDVERCEFMEVSFKQKSRLRGFIRGDYFGVYLQVCETGEIIYPPYIYINDMKRCYLWTKKMRRIHGDVKLKFWVMEAINRCVVDRNREWFRGIQPVLQSTMREILAHKEDEEEDIE